MPYITQADRKRLGKSTIDGNKIDTVGELNYTLTNIIWDYFSKRGNYQAVNDVLGALEGAKLEFYRRVAAPYEDGKIKENGDVYE